MRVAPSCAQVTSRRVLFLTELRREPIEGQATLANILRKARHGVRLNEHRHACKMALEAADMGLCLRIASRPQVIPSVRSKRGAVHAEYPVETGPVSHSGPERDRRQAENPLMVQISETSSDFL